MSTPQTFDPMALAREATNIEVEIKKLNLEFHLAVLQCMPDKQQESRDKMHALLDRSLDIQVELGCLLLR